MNPYAGPVPWARRVRRLVRDAMRRPLLVGPVAGLGRRALLCYVSGPFRGKGSSTHPNQRDVRTIATTLNELGYVCWVVDHDSQRPLQYARYDLVIGFGDAFENAFHAPFDGTRIFYATGASPGVQNRAEITRARNALARSGHALQPRRMVDRSWVASQMLSDGIICMGNEWSLATYRPFNPRIFRIPATHLGHWCPDQLRNEPGRKRSGFLWFGSSGALHKGLDLVLEAMSRVAPEVRLHVCGPVDRETDFFGAYRCMLVGNDQVTLHGRLDPRSRAMAEILEDCGFVILPSCSEGIATSVLTCMYSGLIPVVTEEASIDIGDFGIPITKPTPQAVADSMATATSLSQDEFHRRGTAAAAAVRRNYAPEHHAAALKEAIEAITRHG